MIRLSAAQVDRACGVLLGAAVGDALGAGYEFGSAPFTGSPDMIGGGLGSFAPGEWTDDTAQTVAIARVAAKGLDLRTEEALDEIAAGFAEWYAGGPSDVGIQTGRILGAVGRYPSAETMQTQAAALHRDTGRTGGNGSLMRTSPVALTHLRDKRALVQAAMAVSRLTHPDERAQEACALWCLAIRRAVLRGEIGDLRDGVPLLPVSSHGFWLERIEEAESGEPGTFSPNRYVVTALQAAWSAIVHTPAANGPYPSAQLTDTLATAIGIGDDTDTVGAITGALVGARWGASAVPLAWRELLHGWPGVRADELVRLASLAVKGGRSDGQGWPNGDRVDYTGYRGHDTLVRHPFDDGVWLGGASALDRLPDEVTAVVSLCRLGTVQVPDHLRHAEFRLIDTDEADNPNLDYVISDAARTVARWRDEGEKVFLHCVVARSRTPTVATRYAVLRGAEVDDAMDAVKKALPSARLNPAFVAALRRFP